MAHSRGPIRVTDLMVRQRRLALRVRRHPKGPGKSTDVVRRPVLLDVCFGPCLPPPVVMDQERRLMFSRTPGRIRKLLRKVRGIPVSRRTSKGRNVPVCYPNLAN